MKGADRSCIMSILLIGVVGCGAAATTPCAGTPVAPIILHAKSSTSGESLDSRAQVTIKELQGPFDSFSGPLINDPPSLPLNGIADQVGRFDIQIQVPGFNTWRDTVEVLRATDMLPPADDHGYGPANSGVLVL